MTDNTSKTPIEILLDWKKRLRESQFTHYESAKVFEKYNYWLGVPVVLLATFVGTSVFASIGKTVNQNLQIFVGVVSVLAAVLASLQTFLRFSERSEKHRSVASRYGALRREIEQTISFNDGGVSPDKMDSIRAVIDRLAEEAPNIPTKIWKRRKGVHSETYSAQSNET